MRVAGGIDGVEAVFDEGSLVADAGLLLAGTLAARLGLEALIDAVVRPPEAGRGSGAKVLALVASMLAGGLVHRRRRPADLDVAVVGVPLDIGTSNRPGARFGPRDIRDESVLIRPYNMATRAAPFDSLRIDDTGDVATNPYNLADSVARIETHFTELLSHGVITVALGGDHTVGGGRARGVQSLSQ